MTPGLDPEAERIVKDALPDDAYRARILRRMARFPVPSNQIDIAHYIVHEYRRPSLQGKSRRRWWR